MTLLLLHLVVNRPFFAICHIRKVVCNQLPSQTHQYQFAVVFYEAQYCFTYRLFENLHIGILNCTLVVLAGAVY